MRLPDDHGWCNTMLVTHTNCNNIIFTATMLQYRWHDTRCNNMAVTVTNASAKCSTMAGNGFYFIVALVPWLQHAFPGSLFINPFCAHVVIERFTDREWYHSSGTSFNIQSDSLVVPTQRQEELSINNQQLLIGTYWCNISNIFIEIVTFLSRYAVQFSDYIQKHERERERGSVNRDTKRHPYVPIWKGSVDLNSTSNWLPNNYNLNSNWQLFKNSLIFIYLKSGYR